MAVDAKHPRWSMRLALWTQMRDTYHGEHAVKAMGQTYLPATPGMALDGLGANQKGLREYEAYKTRAVFHDFVREAVQNLVGLLHREPATIELPPEMEPMRESATAEGEGLLALLRKINEAQLTYGRFGMLLEAPDGEGPAALPYIAPYNAFSIINWDVGRREQGRERLELVVLDETESERIDGLTWQDTAKHRVLALASEAEAPSSGQTEGELARPAVGEYVVATTRDSREPAASEFMAPQIAGVKLDFIPFVFVNVNDVVATPGDVPMIGLSNLSLTIYRGEADFRHSLFMQGQETLVVTGADETDVGEGDGDGQLRVGGGARIDLPMGGDAKYVGVSGAGLGEQAKALEADKEAASERGARLLPTRDGSAASGESLRVRVAAKTPTLTGIARAGAEALQEILRMAATWRGLNPEDVVVTPNLDFADADVGPEQLVQLVSAKNMGAPLSRKSVHRWMLKNDMTEMAFDDEEAELETEEPLGLGGDGLGLDDTVVEDNEEEEIEE
jgi:hypothetical protein